MAAEKILPDAAFKMRRFLLHPSSKHDGGDEIGAIPTHPFTGSAGGSFLLAPRLATSSRRC
jgi:hypothetical protein